MKSLGSCYNSTLSDQGQVSELRQLIVKAISTFDKTFLSGKLKLWCMQFELFPCIRWPLTVYEVAISELKTF